MADAEATFLASMKAANEAAGNYDYGATDGASDQKAQSNSDEYDPFQAVPSVQSPAPIQSSPAQHVPFNATVSSGISRSVPSVPPSLSVPSEVPKASPVDEQDFQDESRSMSRASSSEVSVDVEINTTIKVNDETNPHKAEASARAEDTKLEILQLQHSVETPEPHEIGAASPLEQAKTDAPQAEKSEAADAKMNDDGPESDAVADKTTEPPPESRATELAKSDATEPVMQTTKARLPHDTIGILEDRIKDDPRGDLEAWLELISENRKRGKLDEARNVYERFFLVFPTAVSSSLIT